MTTRNLVSAILLVLIALALASCSAPSEAGGSEPSFPASYEELTAALRDGGHQVVPMEPVSQPFFEPEGQVIALDGHQVQVFEFSSHADADSMADTISADGGSIGTTMVSWIEAPHFFRSGRLIVLYVGEDAEVIETLEDLLGHQIAGR